MRHVNGLLAVAVSKRHDYVHRLDLAISIAVTILHRILGVELEFEQGEPERRRHGVRPGNIAIESDRNEAAR